MPLTDKARIAADQKTPQIVEIWRAVTALRSTVSFMNTGAHPDDEASAMLAAMRFRDGIDISYACSTRGEGGQNDIGTEATEALGTLRTAEMEAACDQIDLRMYWLSEGPDDTIVDFGFSKSGVETLDKWGRDRTLARFVHVLRTERPDIICPTFLDVPGQHGHHRAMTEAAFDAFDLAADPDYAGCGLPVWEVKKMYLPAYSGAGQAYDDDLPPPPATLTVIASDRDPVTGWSFAQMGQQSRVKHATQAMGRWISAGQERDYPLHLARSRVDGPDDCLMSGLPATLVEFEVPEIAADLAEAQNYIDELKALAMTPQLPLKETMSALRYLRRAIANCPDNARGHVEHKLIRKEQQLARLMRLLVGARVHARVSDDVLRGGDLTDLEIEIAAREAVEVNASILLPKDWQQVGDQIGPRPDAAISDPYPDTYLPDAPDAPCIDVAVTLDGETASSRFPLEVPPVVVPKHSARLTPSVDIINLASERRDVTIKLSDISPRDANADLDLPNGWQLHKDGASLTVTAPDDVAPGHYSIPLTLNGEAARDVRHISYPHITPRLITQPAALTVRVVRADLPIGRVGYIGGGNDRVCHWLERLGCDVADLSDTDLTAEGIAQFDCIVIGIFAMKFRTGLAEAMPMLHDWARDGGTLVTLYHRPWDNWDATKTAPHRLEIGQPSLRWRVTDETAKATYLAADHPVLHHPNKIGDSDWQGWHKERGLYFAKSWADAYTPLIAMQDPDEQPLKGAWLVADVGKGRHIHTSLILHHQMEKLVPGAFRIMANLLAKRR